MIFELKMPQWGMNMTEGTVTQWHKAAGDTVEKDDPVAEIETAKASNTLDSPVSGTIREILVEVDDTVEVQTIIALIDCPD